MTPYIQYLRSGPIDLAINLPIQRRLTILCTWDTLPLRLAAAKLYIPNHALTDKLQTRHKHTEQTGNDKMRNGGANVQPTPLIPDHEKETQRHDVADGHDHHEQRRRSDAEPPVQNPKVGAHDGERNEDLEDEQGALGKGVEDRDEAGHGVETEAGYGGDVARGEEGGLEEEKEEERNAGIGQRKCSVIPFLDCSQALCGRAESRLERVR